MRQRRSTIAETVASTPVNGSMIAERPSCHTTPAIKPTRSDVDAIEKRGHHSGTAQTRDERVSRGNEDELVAMDTA
jgi:hypothetical protein